jgi:nitroreductase
MHTIQAAHLLEALNWRYAVKKFDATKKIPDASWKAIEESMVLAPSSYGLQPWKFLVIKNPELRAKLRTVSWNQSQITDASHMVVFAQKREVTKTDIQAFVDRMAHIRGGGMTPGLVGYRDMMVGSLADPSKAPGGNMLTYTRAQTYIALGFALYTAAALGIDACPMEGFDPSKYDEMLGLTAKGYHAAVVGTFGYRAADDGHAALKKVRNAHESVVETIS